MRLARLQGLLLASAFLAPAGVLLVVFRVGPLIQAFQYSLTSWNGYSPPTSVGLRNFQAILNDPTFRTAFLNTITILLAIPVWVFLPFFVAAILHERITGWRLFRAAFFLPAVLSPVMIGAFFEVMLRTDGPINALLRAVGLGSITRGWLADTATALPVMVAIVIWATFGIGVLIFLAALAQVNPELHDAARVDGASWLRRQRAVSIPQTLPVIEFWSIIVLISAFAYMFPYVQTLTRGGPGYATFVMEYYAYEKAFADGALGYASAVGVVLLMIMVVVVAIVSFGFWRLRRRMDS